MKMKLYFLIQLVALISTIPFLVSAQANYSYYCINGTSFEKDSVSGKINSIVCQWGCDNGTAISYHQGAVPQANLCDPDPFYTDILIIGILLGLIAFLVWLSRMMKK